MQSRVAPVDCYIRRKCCSEMFQVWQSGYVNFAAKKSLDPEDLMNLQAQDMTRLQHEKWRRAWEGEERSAARAGRQPSFRRLFVKEFGKFICKFGWIGTFFEFLLFLTIVIIKFATDQLLQPGAPSISTTVIVLSLVFGVVYLFQALIKFWFEFYVWMETIYMKNGILGLLFAKLSRLRHDASGGQAVGFVMNVMTKNATEIENSSWRVPYLIVGPMNAFFISFLLYYFVGSFWWVVIVGLFLLVAIQIGSVHFMTIFTERFNILADKRVSLIAQILDGIKTIKAYAYQNFFEQRIKKIRQNQYIYYVLIGLFDSLSQSLQKTGGLALAGILCVLEIYVGNNQLTTSGILAALAAILYVSNYSFFFIYEALYSFAGLKVMCDRINTVMRLPEKSPHEPRIRYSPGHFLVNDLTAKYRLPGQQLDLEDDDHTNLLDAHEPLVNDNAYEDAIKGIQFKAIPGQLIVLTGRIGSGKSTVMRALLGETFLMEGAIIRPDEVAYCATEPFIINDTVQANICLGNEQDSLRLERALKLASFYAEVFEQMPKGELTMLGEKGTTLSGGQRARLGLSRALYAEQSLVYLLDDPFASLDSKVTSDILQHTVLEELCQRRQRIVIIATQNLEVVKEANHVVVLDNGNMRAQGTYAQLDAQQQLEFLRAQQEEQQAAEVMNGEEHLSDEIQAEIDENKPMSEDESKHSVVQSDDILAKEERYRGSVPCKVFMQYWGESCGMFGVFLCIVFSIASSICKIFSSLWLEQWSGASTLALQQRANYVIVYFILVLGMFVFGMLSFLATSWMIAHQGRNIHNNMVRRILGAPMNFFETTSQGLILNRFMSDMAVLDQKIGVSYKMLYYNLVVCCSIIVMMMLANPFLLILAVAFSIYLVWVRNHGLKAARQAIRIYNITVSPIASHIYSALTGITTIRAYKAEQYFLQGFYHLVDLHTKAVLTQCGVNRWASARIDLIQYGFMLILLFSSGFLGGILNAALIAVSLQLGIELAQGFPFAVRLTAEIETMMTAVERALHFTKLPQESSAKVHLMPRLENAIEYHDVSVRYKAGLPRALRNLSFNVKPSERLGVIGRTGSGKSTLFNTLLGFNIISPETRSSGAILLKDQRQANELGVQDLRSKFIYVAQQPFLFSGGSLRDNLDPYRTVSFGAILEALEAVGLREELESQTNWLKSENEPIDVDLLSTGQKQLLGFVRALLAKGDIVLLDEASAFIDKKTEELMEQAMAEYFKDKTTLVIAHKLHTIRKMDTVMALKRGRLLEKDSPAVLEADKTSYLAQALRKQEEI